MQGGVCVRRMITAHKALSFFVQNCTTYNTHICTHMLYIPTAHLRPTYSSNSLQQILEFICFTYSLIHSLNKYLWAYTLCQALSRISYQKKKIYIFSSSLHHTCHFFGVLLTINCHGLIEGREKMSKSF